MKSMLKYYALVIIALAASVNTMAWNEGARDYALAITDDKQEVSNDKYTILCLDKLLSADTTDHQLYYGVYTAILEKGDDDCATTLSEYIKDYLILKPDAFIEGYSKLSKKGKDRFAELLAKRIDQTAELDNHTEAKAYFKYIKNYMSNPDTSKNSNLAEIEQKVLYRLKS